MGKSMPHTILQRKRQERKCGEKEGESAQDRDRGRELEKTLETQRVMSIG
jgi:hypothetical protein